MTPRSVTNANEAANRRGSDTSSTVHVEQDLLSNADLYNTMTPPAYTQSVAGSEVAEEATHYEQEKPNLPVNSPHTANPDSSGTGRSGSNSHEAPEAGPPNHTAQLPKGHFTEPTTDAALAYVRGCSVLPERPAMWLVKKKNFALSSLAAAVLVKGGLVRSKDLALISQHSGTKRDPADPLSAVCFATYDTVGDVMNGLIAGPMEACRQVNPMLVKQEERQNNLQTPNVRVSVFQESSPVPHSQSPPDTTRTPTPQHHPSPAPGLPGSPLQFQPETRTGWEHPTVWSDAPPSGRRNSTLEAVPNAAKQVAIGTGKGLGQIVGAGLKAPMTFAHGLTRGFHNAPKLYGEDVRQYENVTDLRSGLSVSAKGFGHGISDGLSDFFVKPVRGAQKEGALGFAKGCGKGVGNLVCKSASGAAGLVGYSFVGVYKELQGINFTGKDPADVVRDQGEAEYGVAEKELKSLIVHRWCHVMMRQNV